MHITYLGHKVSKGTMWPSEANLVRIAQFPHPENYTQIWGFVNLTQRYWCFIKGFGKIAKPLTDMLQGDASKKKSKRVELCMEVKRAVDSLKMVLITPPVLHLANFSKPFLLETDSSREGLGGVLSQKGDNGWYHPLAYGSQTLSQMEKNYQQLKLEFLALKWAVMEHFKEYLMGSEFAVRMDNNIMSTPNLDVVGH